MVQRTDQFFIKMRNQVAFSIEISKNTQTRKRTLQQFYFTGKWCKEQIIFYKNA